MVLCVFQNEESCLWCCVCSKTTFHPQSPFFKYFINPCCMGVFWGTLDCCGYGIVMQQGYGTNVWLSMLDHFIQNVEENM